jgi:hypothetical protein
MNSDPRTGNWLCAEEGKTLYESECWKLMYKRAVEQVKTLFEGGGFCFKDEQRAVNAFILRYQSPEGLEIMATIDDGRDA